MPHRSRSPLIIALTLGLFAAALLWWRSESKDTLEARASTQRAPAPSAVSASQHPEPAAAVARPTPQLEKPPTTTDGAFRVRVLAAGKPVAGARVQAYLKRPEDGTGTPAWQQAGEGSTGADGTVRLPAAPGSYLLSASAQGHGSARRELGRPSGEAETPVELSLPEGVELRGRVLSADRNEPVPLAELSLHPYAEAVWAFARAVELPEETARASSDPQGRFTFSSLAPGRYTLTAEAPGFSRHTVRIVTVPQPGALEVTLWGAGVLEGFVVGEDGQPAAGAEVLALGGPAFLRTTTGAAGGFSLEVPHGTYVLVARQGERVGRLPGALQVTPGQTVKDLRLTLGAPGGLMGTVTATGEGTPIAGARLVALPSGKRGEAGRASTGADGRYTLALPSGEYDVVVQAPGRTSVAREALVVAPGQLSPVDFQLEGTTAVEGHVADSEGRPLAGAYVRASRMRGPEGLTRLTRTDASGAYRLEGLEVGLTRVSARREQTGHWTQKSTELKPGTTAQVDFALVETGIVQGQVRQSSGAPLTQPALVRALSRQSTLGDLSFTDTDAQGRYQLELPAGLYQLVAVIPGARYLYSHEEDLSVTVPVGAALEQDLVLFDDRGVRGTVLEPSGAPSPYATVVGIQGGEFPMSVPTEADEQGQFILPPRGPQAPPLSLVAHNAGRVGQLAEAREDAEVTVRLRPAATLHGRVVARGGAAPTGFTLQLLQEDGSALPWQERGAAASTFPADTFALEDAPALPLRVSVRTTDGRTGEARVALMPGQSAQVEVALTGGSASIAGRAVWKGGAAPAQAVSVFLDKQLSGGSDAQTGADGRFLLKDVKPGAHTVRLWASADGMPETRLVKVGSAEAVELGDVAVTTRKAAPGTVGAGFSQERGWVFVAWLTPEGPAQKAGVHVGDRLLSVDGQAVRGRQDAEEHTRGTPGTPVRLELRGADGQEQRLQLLRAS